MRFTAKKSLSIILGLLLIAVGFAVYFVQPTQAALLSSASIQLSDPRPSQANTTYTVTYTFPNTTTIKCIDVIFGNAASDITVSSGPSTATAPTGMTTTGSALGTLSGGGLTPASWTTLTNSTNGVLQLENSSGQASTATSITITFSGATNPSGTTFYAQLATYSSLTTHTCSGLVDNSNVMALTTSGGVTTTVTVDPTISFSVAGSSGAVNGGPASDPITTASSIAFGNVSAGGSASSAAQLLTTSTNAAHGANIYIRYTQALTDANSDTIRDQAGTPGSPNSFDGSTSQSSFAYTTDSSTVAMGSNKWAGLTTTNTAIDQQTAALNASTVHVEYQLQLKNTQPPGTYSNVITYTATPTY